MRDLFWTGTKACSTPSYTLSQKEHTLCCYQYVSEAIRHNIWVPEFAPSPSIQLLAVEYRPSHQPNRDDCDCPLQSLYLLLWCKVRYQRVSRLSMQGWCQPAHRVCVHTCVKNSWILNLSGYTPVKPPGSSVAGIFVTASQPSLYLRGHQIIQFNTEVSEFDPLPTSDCWLWSIEPCHQPKKPHPYTSFLLLSRSLGTALCSFIKKEERCRDGITCVVILCPVLLVCCHTSLYLVCVGFWHLQGFFHFVCTDLVEII